MFESDSDENQSDREELKINERYAHKYNEWRNKEEQQKCNFCSTSPLEVDCLNPHFIF